MINDILNYMMLYIRPHGMYHMLTISKRINEILKKTAAYKLMVTDYQKFKLNYSLGDDKITCANGIKCDIILSHFISKVKINRVASKNLLLDIFLYSCEKGAIDIFRELIAIDICKESIFILYNGMGIAIASKQTKIIKLFFNYGMMVDNYHTYLFSQIDIVALVNLGFIDSYLNVIYKLIDMGKLNMHKKIKMNYLLSNTFYRTIKKIIDTNENICKEDSCKLQELLEFSNKM